MDNVRASPSGEELILHLFWVQRLARTLVRGRADAEDLAQETMRITLAQPQGRVGSGARLRAWLRAVVLRLARDRRRAAQSRSAREQVASASEATATTFEVVARSARQQRVARAVMELDEPCRSTVLYRYLDELSTQEVASRMSVSEEVVRKRLSRALALLRGRLDQEFGADTRTWALALLLPSVDAIGQATTAATAATAGAGTKAGLTLKGILFMTLKTKFVIAGLLLVGTVVTLHLHLDSRREPAAPERLSEGMTSPDSAGALAASPSIVEAGRAAEGIADSNEKMLSITAPGDDDLTILRVRVEHQSGRICTTGEIGCWWDTERVHPADRSHFCATLITGEVTELRLPSRAGEALLSASIKGEPPADSVWVPRLRMTAEGPRPFGTLMRDVVIFVGTSVEGPRLFGCVRVDGSRRIPTGLVVRYESRDLSSETETVDALLNFVDATYEIGPCERGLNTLWITSAETVPLQLKHPAKETDERFDLDLASGRELLLTVLDESDGKPLANLELYRTVQLVVERGLRTVHWRDRSGFFKTDGNGQALLKGLPLEGKVEIRRDASMRELKLAMRDGGLEKIKTLKEPLFTLPLTREMPQRLEHVLRIPASQRTVRLFGWLVQAATEESRAPGDLRVQIARIEADGRPAADPEQARLSEEGSWELEVAPRGRYQVWLARDVQRLSEVVTVETGEEDLGPIDLGIPLGVEVELRLVNCPPSGVVGILVEDDREGQWLRVPMTEGSTTVTKRVKLDRARYLEVSFSGENEPGSESRSMQRRLVDPFSQGVVEIDLHGDEHRMVFLEIENIAPEELMVVFVSLEDSASSQVLVDLECGASRSPAILPAGRYLWIARGGFPGIAAGVADVHRSGDVKLSTRMKEHPRAALGKGITLEEIDGFSLAALDERARRIDWDDAPELNEAGTIHLPARCRFTVETQPSR